MSNWTVMDLQSMIERRDRFRLATDAKGPRELSLREKQATVDVVFSGKPMPNIFYREVEGDDGKPFYLVLRGWAYLQALFDFTDNKFRTWTDEEKQEYMQSHA